MKKFIFLAIAFSVYFLVSESFSGSRFNSKFSGDNLGSSVMHRDLDTNGHLIFGDGINFDSDEDETADIEFFQGKITASKINTSSVTARDALGLYLLEAGGNGIYVEDGGFVSIGIPNPSSNLHIGGTSGRKITTIQSGDIGSNNLVLLELLRSGTYRAYMGASDKGFGITMDGTPIFNDDTFNAKSKIFIDRTSGFVGISTSNPTAQLHVYSDEDIDCKIQAANGGVRLDLDSASSTNPSSQVRFLKDTELKFQIIYSSYTSDADTDTLIISQADFDDILTLEQSGNVGIDNINPEEKLDINGTIRISSNAVTNLYLRNTELSDAFFARKNELTFKGTQSGGEESTLGKIRFSHGSSSDDEKGFFQLFLNDGNDGNNPTTVMDFDGEYFNIFGELWVFNEDGFAIIHNTTQTDNDGGRQTRLIFRGEQSGGEISTLTAIEGSHEGTGDDEKARLKFRINDGDDGVAPTDRMIITSIGNVGISTGVPTERLEVIGNIKASATTYSPNMDCTDLYVSTIHAKSPITIDGYLNFSTTHTLSSPNTGDLWRDENGLLKYQKNVVETMEISNYPSNIVYVNSMSDLPPPDEFGDIQLEGKIYQFPVNTVLSSTFSLVYSSFSSTNIKDLFYIYTGTGTAIKAHFTQPTYSQLFSSVIQCNNGGTALDISAEGLGILSYMLIDKLAVSSIDMVNPSCSNVGTISDMICVMEKCVWDYFTGEGLVIKDISTFDLTSSRGNAITGVSGNTIFKVTGTVVGAIQIAGFTPIVDTNQYALDFSSNTLYSYGITYNRGVTQFEGTATPDNIFKPGSYDNKTVGFKFNGNPNIPDSTVTGRFINTNTLIADIPAQNAIVIIETNTWSTSLLERLGQNGASNEYIRYLGLEDTVLTVNSKINLEPITASKSLSSILYKICETSLTVTFDNTTNIVIRANHGLINGEQINFKNEGGALPAGLRDDIIYYVVNATTNNFQVSYSLGGAAVTFTTNGTGTSYYFTTCLLEESTNTVANLNPIDMVINGAIGLFLNKEKLVFCVRNNDDAVDINIYNMRITVRR